MYRRAAVQQMQNADAGSEDDGDAMKGLKEENYEENEEEV